MAHMNTCIEIYDNKTEETGTYKVWYYNAAIGKKCVIILSKDQVNDILEMRQKEKFFMW